MNRQQQGVAPISSTSGRVINEGRIEPKFISALSWESIPPEILERIMDYLDKGDRTWFNSMRLVNLHWGSVANSMMERYRHRVLKAFNPFNEVYLDLKQIYEEKFWPFFIPKVKIFPYSKNSDVLKEIEWAIITKLQKGGAESEIERITGFPSSLYLCPEVTGVTTRSGKFELENLSSKLLLSSRNATHNEIEGHVFGRHLTSLVLHEIEYSPEQLQKILKSASQLQVLVIFKTMVMIKNYIDFEETWPLPTLPRLTTLVVRLNSAGNRVGTHHQITRWLTKPYSSIDQLTHLEIDNARYVDPWQNAKLEQLKIFGFSSLPLETPKVTALLRLSILDHEQNNIPFHEFLLFIQQFSKKLEYLHLDLNFKDVEWRQPGMTVIGFQGTLPEIPELPNNDILFPRLKALALPFNALTIYLPVTEYLIRNFPNLETLHLISATPSRCHCCAIKLRTQSNVIWDACPNLKQIRLYQHITGTCWKRVKKGDTI